MLQAAIQSFSENIVFPAFELSVFNVDKPPLDEKLILQRVSQFAGYRNILITNAPTFIVCSLTLMPIYWTIVQEKARLFPGATFVVGYDTAVRIIQKKYYGDSIEKMKKGITAPSLRNFVDGIF